MSDMYVFVAPGLTIDEVSHPCSASILLALLDVLLLAGLARRALARVGRLCRAQRDALALAHAPADCAACATLTLTDRAARSSSLSSLKKKRKYIR